MSIASSLRKATALVCLLSLASLCSSFAAQPKPARTDAGAEPVRSILWVGNSFFYYNNSMHGHYNELARAAEPDGRHRGTSVTISGSGLDWHDMASLLRDDGIGRYSFAAGNRIVFNKPGKQFDAVIMMDCSQCPIHPQLAPAFHETVKKDAAIIAKYGARPILFMSWAYKDAPEMTAQLAEQYTIAGNANNALVVPAGLAFAKAIARGAQGGPQVNLYDPDKRHPSLAGSYLSACTILAAVYGKSPVGNSYVAALEPKTARFLQEVAHETVREYLGL